jgi:hypothetical protein
MNKLEHATRGITSTISNPMYISYSLLGISSLILGYYTFFDNKIDETVQEPELKEPEPIQEVEEPEPEEPVQEVEEPIQEQEPVQTQEQPLFQGGKKKKTKRTKHRKNKRTIKR